MKKRLLAVVSLALMCTGCFNDGRVAPVHIAQKPIPSQNGLYRVQSGDTVYSIAWAFNLDYRQLAENNALSEPYTLHPGSYIRVSFSRRRYPYRESLLKATKAHRPTLSPQPMKLPKKIVWHWPVHGKIILGFHQGRPRNPGIDIGGRLGQPIRATAAGEVVYRGNGIRGYGNLIILKHSDTSLSAYAFNQSNRVKTGDRVQALQPIATMGKNTNHQAVLHFEIRQNGASVNPVRYLTR